MKKFLIVLALMFASLPVFAIDTSEKTVREIGFKILNANTLDKRVVFKAVPVVKDTGLYRGWHSWELKHPESTYLAHSDRTITIFENTLRLADNQDELAAILSQGIAQAQESYKGLFRGFFAPPAGVFTSKKYEDKADLKAVDYMVNAGYNPVALIAVYNKDLGQTRYEWCHPRSLASKRMMNVYGYVYDKYPQYLKNNQYAENVYYVNFLLTSKDDMKKFEKKRGL